MPPAPENIKKTQVFLCFCQVGKVACQVSLAWILAPRQPQNGAKRSPNDPQMTPRATKMELIYPQSDLRIPQSRHQGLQMMVQRQFKSAPSLIGQLQEAPGFQKTQKITKHVMQNVQYQQPYSIQCLPTSSLQTQGGGAGGRGEACRSAAPGFARCWACFKPRS